MPKAKKAMKNPAETFEYDKDVLRYLEDNNATKMVNLSELFAVAMHYLVQSGKK